MSEKEKKNFFLGSVLALASSAFYAIGLIMVTVFANKLGIVNSTTNYWSIALIWASCSLYIISDGIIAISCNVESGSRTNTNTQIRSLCCNILFSSLFYCCAAIGHIYVAYSLGPSIQSSLDSTQILFLTLLLPKKSKSFNSSSWANISILSSGVIVYFCGIYLLSYSDWSSSLSSPLPIWMLFTSIIVVLLMTYNGILFEKATKQMNIVLYMLLQSCFCFCILSVVVWIFIPIDGSFIKSVYTFAGINHIITVLVTYSEAFAIKFIGYYKFVMIQTIAYPLFSFILTCIFTVNQCSIITLSGLILVCVGLFLFYQVFVLCNKESTVKEQQEDTPLLAI